MDPSRAYEIKQGFINITAQIDKKMEENPTPSDITENKLENHIMGVILVLHFSLKKGSN